MRFYQILRLILIMLFLIMVLVSCTSPSTQSDSDLLATEAAFANTENNFDVEQVASVPQLAINIEFTSEGINAVSTRIIYNIAQTDEMLNNDLVVVFQEGDKVFAEYNIPDPRIAEVEGGEYIMLPTAQTYVYVPLNTALTELIIKPLSKEGQSELPGKNSIDLVDLIQQACEQQPEVDECKELVNHE